MRQITVVILAISACLALGFGPKPWEWGYSGDKGPEKWGKHFPKCAGYYQSPINIDTKKTTFNRRLGDLDVHFDPQHPNPKFTVENNGKTAVEVHVGDSKLYVTNGGLSRNYSTELLYFHWGSRNSQGSEHTVDGKSSPLEMHIVNVDKSLTDPERHKDGLAVLGILFTLSENDNPALERILGAIKQVQDLKPDDEADIPAHSIRALLPTHPEKYYRYRGSLTTPPCYESVIWTVFKNKQTISQRQSIFSRLNYLDYSHIRLRNRSRKIDKQTLFKSIDMIFVRYYDLPKR